MATGDSRIPGIEEWADRLAVGALVVGGLLVSIGAPILRKRNETLRADLDELGAELRATIAPPEGDEDQGAEPEGQAAAVPHLAAALNGQAAELVDDAP